jgi:hypothetical protein
MLALEHKATLIPDEDGFTIVVQAQPFGGAVRLIKHEQLAAHVDGFNFDSERSRSEQDFRVYIQPSSWEAVLDFCLQARFQETDPFIESDPTRELTEEFIDTLGTPLKPDQYASTPAGIVVEKQPSPTTNIRAIGVSTARIYWTYKVEIQNQDLCRSMLENSEKHPAAVLRRMVMADSRAGDSGRANAILVAPLADIHAAYRSVPIEVRENPLPYGNTILAGNVPAVLDEVASQKYTRLTH